MKLFIIYLLLINTFAFTIMYIDKQKAIKKKWRIKESFLISISAIGGTIGMLFGMNIFRHKTKHIKFKVGIPIILFAQIALLYVVTIY